MRRLVPILLVLLAAPLTGAAPSGAAALVPLTVAGTWASEPIHAASPVGDDRLFVVERGGTVRIMVDGVLQPQAFVTVPNVDTEGERGLLSIAFPIDFATSRRFYVFASIAGTPAQTRIIEYRVSASDRNLADPTSARVVLTQDLSSPTNHNGGQLAFGGDRRLYVTLGDNTARDKAQTDDTYLGKVLRIDPADPDGAGPLTFTVPTDNPTPGSAIWAKGLRNPYRASFDTTGRLIIADVGEADVEEVNIGAAGANYGWPLCEGACANAALTNPFHVYRHSGAGQGCSIIGGVTVRDPRLTGLAGRYLFGDYCQGDTRTIDLGPSGPAARAEMISTKINGLIGFADDAQGCPYLLGNGTISRVAATAADGKACGLPFIAASAYPPPPPVPTPVPTPTPPVVDPAPTATPAPLAPPTPPAGPPSPSPSLIPTPSPTPAPFVIPRNCVRRGQMSIRSSKGTITAARLVTGKSTKPIAFKRNGARVELRNLSSATRLKIRITIRTKRKRILNETKTFRACP